MTRVLMTADTVGGVWSYAMGLAADLQSHGVEILLVTMGDPLSAQQRKEAAAHPNLELVETSYRLEWMDDPWSDVDAAGEKLMELESSFAPDVVHLNGYAHAALPWNAPVLVVAHSCVFSWWQAVHHESAPARYREYHRRVAKGLCAATKVVAPTRAMMDELQIHYGFCGSHEVIFNGISGHTHHSGSKEPFIMAAGRLWDEAKNYALLDEVAPALEWPVWIAGNPAHPDGTSRPFSNLKSMGQIAPAALEDCMNRAAIFAHPARYEPFGLSVLEAALSGCALVLGDIPSLRELWDKAAIFVSPDNPTALHDALANLIQAPAQCKEMASLAQKRAACYSGETMALKYASLYAELIRERKEASR